MAKYPELGAVLVAALYLAGCGSGSEQRVAPRPTLPPPVASTLASRSDEVAQALDAGNSCRALSVAHQLQQETIAAINAGRVPDPFQEPLGSIVSDLVSRIHCARAATPHDRGKHKGKDKEKHEEND